MTREDVDNKIKAKVEGSYRRVWKRTGPTLGAIVLFLVVAF